MIEIADLSQVSRATLYNHYRDKEAVLYALVASEVVRVFENSTGTPADILEFLSIQISQDRALAAMRQHDGALLVSLTQRTSDRIWSAIDSFLLTTMNNQTGADLALVWLMGQFLHPLSAKDSREQAAFLVERTLF
ncbi:unannotated protein [freshwater metagenome]|uniref:Unannotated protein n=1 Tax=freshwater metagenome TaxID=449393 RepID=A0A6J7XR37_9ZZZZ